MKTALTDDVDTNEHSKLSEAWNTLSWMEELLNGLEIFLGWFADCGTIWYPASVCTRNTVQSTAMVLKMLHSLIKTFDECAKTDNQAQTTGDNRIVCEYQITKLVNNIFGSLLVWLYEAYNLWLVGGWSGEGTNEDQDSLYFTDPEFQALYASYDGAKAQQWKFVNKRFGSLMCGIDDKHKTNVFMANGIAIVSEFVSELFDMIQQCRTQIDSDGRTNEWFTNGCNAAGMALPQMFSALQLYHIRKDSCGFHDQHTIFKREQCTGGQGHALLDDKMHVPPSWWLPINGWVTAGFDEGAKYLYKNSEQGKFTTSKENLLKQVMRKARKKAKEAKDSDTSNWRDKLREKLGKDADWLRSKAEEKLPYWATGRPFG